MRVLLALAILTLFGAGLANLPVAPPAAASNHCPPHLPVMETFGSEGLFAYSAKSGPSAGDAAHLTGPTVVCRERIQVPPECFSQGSASAQWIRTEMIRLDLAGWANAGHPVVVEEDPARASPGQVGEAANTFLDGIPLLCTVDPRTGERTVEFDGPIESFFDVHFRVELPGGPVAGAVQVHNVLCGLPEGNPEGIKPCNPGKPYRHAGLSTPLTPQGLVGSLAPPPVLYSDAACHMPFFSTPMPPAACAVAESPMTDGRHSTNPIRFHVAMVSGHPVDDAFVTEVKFPPGKLGQVLVSELQDRDGNGVLSGEALVVPSPATPRCDQGEVPIEILGLSLVGIPQQQVPWSIALRWCLYP